MNITTAMESFQKGIDDKKQGVALDDFYAYTPDHKYIYKPTGQIWVKTGVNADIPPIEYKDKDSNQKRMLASDWLDRNRSVQQMTWMPGEPQIIKDRLMIEGTLIEKRGVKCFNRYRPPNIQAGDDSKATPWIDHVRKVYPNEADHIIKWLAARVQRPWDKPNHNLVLGGIPGVGKDTILVPVKTAVGSWNFSEVSPETILNNDFNPYVECVILRISEAHDIGDFSRFQFYDKLKNLSTSPPETIMVNKKHMPEYHIPKCLGVIITSNHKDAFFLPRDDRRHFVAWSDMMPEDFGTPYFDSLYNWFESGGNEHVYAYLKTLDISDFNIKAPPDKTPVFWEIVSLNAAPEDASLMDIIDDLGEPDAITLDMIIAQCLSRYDTDFAEWLKDRKNRRAIPHRLDKCGYVPVRNDAAESGLWRINDKRQVVYAKKTLSLSGQLRAAGKLR